MQREPIASSEQSSSTNAPVSSSSSNHGSLQHEFDDLHQVRPEESSSASPRSLHDHDLCPHSSIDAEHVDEKLRGLSLGATLQNHPSFAGQRVSDYEKAVTPPTPRHALGFKVIKRSSTEASGLQLTDFPNEILTQILSHLHPDSHAAVALVSRQFHVLVTSSHAWRMAFLRYFPGHAALLPDIKHQEDGVWDDPSNVIRSETRYFNRLTPLASWKSEYWFRTRLLRSLARGKPGGGSAGIGSSVRTSQNGKKSNAVLTYNSKLPWLITNVHAVFSNGKKPPRAIHGVGDLGVANASDPTTGKIDKWGIEDSFASVQLDEVVPNLVPFGLGDGPAANPNVMDVSQPYGMLAGEGFPGGRAYYRSVNELRSQYLGAETGVADTYPDIPKIPEMSEAMCCVWLAKSSAVPTTTKSVVGMLTGSTLGIITAYSLGSESSATGLSNGDMTARWVVSPGVPIISIKVDDSYSYKRNAAQRVWAVALNALGEVYYLTEAPSEALARAKGEDVAKNAWYTGRTVYWHLLEATRRNARPDELDKNAIKGAYSPRSPSNSMNLNKEQLAAEAREIEKFLRHKPAHFRKVCEGWDMQRKLEVDFTADDGQGAGESVFVIDRGLAEGVPTQVNRYCRSQVLNETKVHDTTLPDVPPPSLFGSVQATDLDGRAQPENKPKYPTPTSDTTVDSVMYSHEWLCQTMDLQKHSKSTITACALDNSNQAMLTLADDPLYNAFDASPATNGAQIPRATVADVPGRRARLLVVGTKGGVVIAWNARDEDKRSPANPVRIIQTESPEISSLAATALYLVHGGSDGLVQAWDPLASTTEPIRTLNSRSNGRVPRHMLTMNPALREDSYTAVGAIFLDPDPMALRGVISFGAFLRYWAYSSKGHPTGRKRRHRHIDVSGRTPSRRLGNRVSGFIASEEAELRRENQQRVREQTRLKNRFGVGALGDLTEEEALRYAQMISEEAFLQEEQRRTSDSAADASLDTASSFSETSADTITPEPSVAGPSGSNADTTTGGEDSYEQQIQQAIRLSLMEGVNETEQSQRGNSSGDYEFSVKYKPKDNGKKTKGASYSSPYSDQKQAVRLPVSSAALAAQDDEDLAMALSLSMQDQEAIHSQLGTSPIQEDEFPPLEGEAAWKGKGVWR